VSFRGYVSSLFFFFLFIDAGVFEDRAVAMGKPHCNRSIYTFVFSVDWSSFLPSAFFRVSASASSVKFRVRPWLILLPLLFGL
jgi:hypothetical protein